MDHPVWNVAVTANPVKISSAPAIKTRVVPLLSAMAQNTGCAMPETTCPTAKAKLTEVMLSPAIRVKGATNNPKVFIVPDEIANIAAAAATNTHSWVFFETTIFASCDE
jgi:hypothetical protein